MSAAATAARPFAGIRGTANAAACIRTDADTVVAAAATIRTNLRITCLPFALAIFVTGTPAGEPQLETSITDLPVRVKHLNATRFRRKAPPRRHFQRLHALSSA